MAHSNLEAAVHMAHQGHKFLHTQTGQATAAAAVVAATAAAPVVIPVAAVVAVGYGIYRMFGGK